MTRHLYAPDMPDPDVLVRTSGEYRISNFLLWQLAYAELVFTDVLWPDFRRADLFAAIARVPAPRPSLRHGGGVTRHRNHKPVVRLRGWVSTGTRVSCCAPSSSARPTGSSASSPSRSGKVARRRQGVRKPGSRFGARLEPTSLVAFQCYRGRELDVVTQVETIAAHRPLREHYGCLTHAVPMLEVVDQVAPEREPNPALYQMLVGALRTLTERPSPIVSTAFFWKLLSLEGFQPAARRVRRLRRRDAARSSPSISSGRGALRVLRPRWPGAASIPPPWR